MPTRAYALHIDKKGLIWYGTSEGLNCLDPLTDSIKQYTVKEWVGKTTTSLPSQAIERGIFGFRIKRASLNYVPQITE